MQTICAKKKKETFTYIAIESKEEEIDGGVDDENPTLIDRIDKKWWFAQNSSSLHMSPLRELRVPLIGFDLLCLHLVNRWFLSTLSLSSSHSRMLGILLMGGSLDGSSPIDLGSSRCAQDVGSYQGLYFSQLCFIEMMSFIKLPSCHVSFTCEGCVRMGLQKEFFICKI